MSLLHTPPSLIHAKLSPDTSKLEWFVETNCTNFKPKICDLSMRFLD